ncbi:TPA: glycoside hydrolase family 104 protein [Burkholderia vietnamiensis]|uniref:glycoside hydrolase family 24 protein n=1 Tax=Burkholderia vietnamiensis TaxID=60552 RepID=UPI001593D181|nr:glycoside hydrolase family 104 protein [Burkholderia vietnamiensis]MBR8150948.1 glycoside hydrolase family 104 protein [Burkholderia vietnamiensis]MCA8207488.1 glycoside hydrolase family 104 protein [Burkholderia vietnamiensis]HDR9118961.1 glycoside hydrolase family 104 protein [Burkholderia vietnamiensis]
MARITASAAGGQNVVAFLDMIAASEIDAWTRQNSDDGYNVLVGSHGPMKRSGSIIAPRLLTFPSYAKHPGIYNAELNSTAAGRYQLLSRYYAPYAQLLKLNDFSPLSQDLIAIQQIRERRALPLIAAGQLSAAIKACSNIWASLPGNDYGQRQNELAMLTAAYKAAGGIVAIA